MARPSRPDPNRWAGRRCSRTAMGASDCACGRIRASRSTSPAGSFARETCSTWRASRGSPGANARACCRVATSAPTRRPSWSPRSCPPCASASQCSSRASACPARKECRPGSRWKCDAMETHSAFSPPSSTVNRPARGWTRDAWWSWGTVRCRSATKSRNGNCSANSPSSWKWPPDTARRRPGRRPSPSRIAWPASGARSAETPTATSSAHPDWFPTSRLGKPASRSTSSRGKAALRDARKPAKSWRPGGPANPCSRYRGGLRAAPRGLARRARDPAG